MIVDNARSGLANRLVQNTVAAVGWMAVGSGSGLIAVSTTGLFYHVDRNAFTSTDVTVANRATMTTDWTFTELSGTTVKEFAVYNLSSGGKAWQVEGFPGILFDGSNELRVEATWEVY